MHNALCILRHECALAARPSCVTKLYHSIKRLQAMHFWIAPFMWQCDTGMDSAHFSEAMSGVNHS